MGIKICTAIFYVGVLCAIFGGFAMIALGYSGALSLALQANDDLWIMICMISLWITLFGLALIGIISLIELLNH